MPFLSDIRAMILAGLLAVFVIISAVLYVEANGLLWIDGLKDELEDCTRDRNELRAISDKRNEQKRETSKRIEQADKGNRDADQRAREIEEAPLPGDCRTPDEVMRADV